ncbi:MAG: fibronectin type III domain-containing protein, partial [Patescibacteria group bacterium]
TTPVSVSGITNAVAIAGGMWHSLAITGGLFFQVAANTDNSTWNYKPLPKQIGVASNRLVIPPDLDNNRYIRYKAYLSTSDGSFTSSLDNLTVNYRHYSVSGELTSSAYDAADAANVLSKIQWAESLATSTDIKFQLRTSANGSAWSGWCGPDDGTSGSCNSSTYFTNPSGGETVDDIFRDGSNDRWIQYKAFLTSDGGFTPTISSTTLTYVVNAPPNFDATYGTNGVTVSQSSGDTDYDSDGASDIGEVLLIYSVRDTDTNSGTVNPGQITPSFEYRLNSGASWTSITSGYLNTGALSLKNVSQDSYTSTSTTVNASTTSALWNAVSQLGTNTFSTTTQIKITINDNEAANNIASSTSAVFTLDTKAPAAAAFTIDSSAGATSSNIVSYNLSDDSNLSFIFSNNSSLSADGSNASSGAWIAANATSTNASTTWTLSGSPNEEKIYYRVKDVYGNMTATTTVTAPAIGSQNASSINIKDISNVSTNEWREFISWSPFTATSGAAFSSYQLYRSTNGTTYNSLATITASSTNYYTDASVSSSTTYYYKVRFVDTDGDISEFSASVNDYVDGQGGTDITAPVISNVSSTPQSTWTKITWTTDEYSDSKVEYSTSAGVFTSSVLVDTIVASTTPHTVYLASLTPNTTYYYRVKSKDVLNNEATDPTSGNGYSFTTIGGPVISNVSCSNVTDNSADVIWNTTADSNSQVDYSVSASLTNATSVSSGMVGTSTAGYYQHKITLSGLTQGATYYFRVQSTDGSSNTSVDNNNGSFYQCRTTRDTKAPVISGISTPVITDTAVVIIWATDERATSQVEYGQTSAVSGSYATTTTRDNTLTINHVVTLTGLIKETRYYYRVKSYDMNPDSPTAVSDEQNFTSAAEKQTIIVYVASGGGGGTVSDKDTVAPAISGIEITDIGAFGAVVNFNTNEQATAFVNYGENQNYGYNVGSPEFNSSHKVYLTGLKMGTDYNFKIKAIDKSGNYSYSENKTFKTKYFAEALEDLATLENAEQFQEAIEKSIESILPSILPPFIEKPRVSDITEDSAIIKWKTNIQAYSVVAYAPEDIYASNIKNASSSENATSSENPYISEVSKTDKKTKEHEIALIGLNPNTKYHFMAKSFSLPQATGKSADLTFTTKAPKIAPRVVDIDKDAIRIVWTTTEKSSSIVEYKNLRTGEVLRKIDEQKIIEHDVRLENLDPGTSYEINVTGYNEKDNLIEAGDLITVKTSRDIAPPEISNIRIDGALVPGRNDKVQTVISWRTNEPANSIVEYEEGSGKSGDELANKVSDIGTFTDVHTIIVAKLKPGTLYRVKITSIDEAGNKTVSPIRTIITPRQSESIIDVIVKNFEDTFQFLRKLR